jgi:hypothetical protein
VDLAIRKQPGMVAAQSPIKPFRIATFALQGG